MSSVDAFNAASTGMSTDSPEGEKLTAGELKKIAQHVDALPANESALIWRGLIDQLGGKFDAKYLKDLQQRLGNTDGAYPENLYITHIAGAVSGSPYLEAMREEIELGARKEGIKAAVTKQMSIGAEGKTALIKIIDDVRTDAEASLLSKAWIALASKGSTGNYDISTKQTDAAKKSLNSFRVDGAGATDVDSYIAALTGAPVKVGDTTFAKNVDALLARPETASAVMQPDRLRPAGYQRIVDEILAHPITKEIIAPMRALLKEQELGQKSVQALQGALLDKDTSLASLFPWGQKLYNLTQETAAKTGFFKSGNRMGADEVEVIVQSAHLPNAFVYSIDDLHPRLTIFTPMIKLCWDDETSDWLTITVDANGKPVPAGQDVEGAQELPIGKLLVESVIAHELGHIRDDVILFSSLFQMLYVYGGFEIKADQAGLTEQEVALKEKAKLFLDEFHGDKTKHNQGLPLAELSRLEGKFDQVFRRAGITREDAAKALCEITGVDHDQQASIAGLGGLEDFYRQYFLIGRAAEHTADRWAFFAQGTNKWTAFMDLLLTVRTNFDDMPTTAAKKHQLSAILREGHENFASTMLNEFAADKVFASRSSVEELMLCVSHPPGPIRIQLGDNYVNDDASYFKAIEEFKAITDPVEKLLSGIQAYQNLTNGFFKSFDSQAHQKLAGSEQILMNAQVKPFIRQWRAYTAPLMEALDTVLTDAELVSAKSPAYKQVIEFVKEGGAKAWKDTPMVGLLTHLKTRLATLSLSDLPASQLKVVEKRLKVVRGRLATAKKDQTAMFEGNAKKPELAEQLRDLLTMLDADPTDGE